MTADEAKDRKRVDDITISDIKEGKTGLSANERAKVVFDIQSAASRRRKNSIVGSGLTPSSCFVHSILEAQHRKYHKKDRDGIYHKEDTIPVDGSLTESDYCSSNDEESSRMLTKRQLSEMALGVRELSKNLSHVTMRLPSGSVKILLVTKIHDKALLQKSRELIEWLLSSYPRHIIYVQDVWKEDPDLNLAALPDDESIRSRIKYWNVDFCRENPHLFDLLGGDGTVLYASWLFQKVVPPVLSFAMGSLGFMTLFDFDHYKRVLKDSFELGIRISLRMRFECTIMRTKKEYEGEKYAHHDLCREITEVEAEGTSTHTNSASYTVLNELVVDRGPNPTLSSTELFGDDEHLTTIQADGICIATPTGSTAYSLAAGGSLSHPENPVILVSPICAHSLSFRPIIVPDSMVLRVGVPYDSRTTAWASFDGKERIELKQGDYVTIVASRFPFATIQRQKTQKDFFDSLSRTLQWNSRSAKQKPFDNDDNENGVHEESKTG